VSLGETNFSKSATRDTKWSKPRYWCGFRKTWSRSIECHPSDPGRPTDRRSFARRHQLVARGPLSVSTADTYSDMWLFAPLAVSSLLRGFPCGHMASLHFLPPLSNTGEHILVSGSDETSVMVHSKGFPSASFPEPDAPPAILSSAPKAS